METTLIDLIHAVQNISTAPMSHTNFTCDCCDASRVKLGRFQRLGGVLRGQTEEAARAAAAKTKRVGAFYACNSLFASGLLVSAATMPIA